MKVAFYSDSETGGGASIAASRLANALAREGQRVTRFHHQRLQTPFGEPREWTSRYLGPDRPLELLINGLSRGAARAAAALAQERALALLRRGLAEESCDLLHIHALHNGPLRHAGLRRLPPDFPVVWTFHDCWSFSPEAWIFRDEAGALQRLKPDGANRARSQAVRNAYFGSRSRCTLVAPSRAVGLLAQEALHSPVEVVLHGLDLALFRPLPQDVARAALRIPQDALVIAFVADRYRNSAKGFSTLEAALLRLARPGFVVLVAGDEEPQERALGQGSLRVFGRIVQPALLTQIYAAADLLVLPSRVEALGQVAMEAIACGTPVIGAEIGGIPDVVIPGRTGWLFPAGDVDRLHALLAELVSAPERIRALAANCRAHAEEFFGERRGARAYLGLYQALLEARAGPGH